MLYSDDIVLPRVSNREDLYLLVGLYDDDTGDAINLSGTTGSGTFASWTVSIQPMPGIPNSVQVNTTSTTSLTIASGTQTLTVNPFLTIFPQQPVMLTASGGTMFGTVLAYTPATGALQVSIGMQFTFEIRNAQPRGLQDGYAVYWGIGTYPEYGPIITAYTGAGISIIDVGIIQIEVLESKFRTICTAGRGRTFNVALQMFDGYHTRQIFTGSLPVTYGGVTG